MTQHSTRCAPSSAGATAAKSEAALAQFEEFAARVRSRLEVGKNTYGDKSFDRPQVELVEEIRQELLDVCGWAYILYHRLTAVEAALQPGQDDEYVRNF